MCPYCEERFTSPSERGDHILKVPHKDAPWPMLEDLCAMAQFDTASTDELPGNKLGMWDFVTFVTLAPRAGNTGSRNLTSGIGVEMF